MSKRTASWLPDALYRSIMKYMPIMTVDVLFLNPSRDLVLLGRRTKKPLRGSLYSFGGRLLKNESFADAAVRHAKRELGIHISKKNLIVGGVLNEVFRDSIYPGINAHTVNVYFGYRLRGNELFGLDTQHSECAWVSVQTRTLHPYMKEKIKNIFAAL